MTHHKQVGDTYSSLGILIIFVIGIALAVVLRP